MATINIALTNEFREWLEEKAKSNAFYKKLADYAHEHKNQLTGPQYSAAKMDYNKEQLSKEIALYKLPNWDIVLAKFNTALDKNVATPKITLINELFNNTFKLRFNAKRELTWLSWNDAFVGSIDASGVFAMSRHTRDTLPIEVFKELRTLVNSIDDHIIAFGLVTGNCSFCNRPLTNALSVNLGYGPICAEKYGMPYELVNPTYALDLG